MSSTLESRSKLVVPRPDVRVYTGLEVTDISRPDLIQGARAVHRKLGEEKAKGHMHQPPLKRIVHGMETGAYALSMVRTDEGRELVVATSHIRASRTDRSNAELGGVVKLLDVPGQGRAVAQAGVQLGIDQGARQIDAVVAERNTDARQFFRGLVGPENPGTRKSDYVRDPITDEFVDVVVFNVTELGKGEK